ncbi:MAG TPA: Hsp20/alpha crystallin family protein [Myxococcota bacterium]|nr:Hsp20/alpha crystallin family protein [Myxococcota bacterium]
MAEETKAVKRWNPFRDELFFPESWLREWDLPFGRLSRRLEELGRRTAPLSPAVDLTEDDKSFIVTAELPGVGKDDVTVELNEDVLTIRGEKKSEREEKKDRSHWVERSYGAFSRSFTLPPTAQAEEMKASFKDGVLRIEIPKKEAVKPRQISIK